MYNIPIDPVLGSLGGRDFRGLVPCAVTVPQYKLVVGYLSYLIDSDWQKGGDLLNNDNFLASKAWGFLWP